MKNLNNIIKKVLKEQSERYMFFSNLEQMHRQCEILLSIPKDDVENILNNGHDWAQDHIAESKNNLDQVFDFMMNEIKGDKFSSDDAVKPEEVMEDDNIIDDLAMTEKNPDKALALYQMTEGRKKSGTKLCARGKAAAKSKFDVYPSAYANGYAVQVCKGTKPGLDGKKHCSGAYC
jgi:ribonuclease D